MRSLTWKPKLGGLMWFVDGVNPLKQTFSNAVFSGSIGARKKNSYALCTCFSRINDCRVTRLLAKDPEKWYCK